MSEIISQLKALKLHGMADSYAELLQQGSNASMDMSHWLIQHLLDAETTQRAIRSIGYQMASARFPVHRTLADFDFSQAKVDESLIKQLATFAFTETAQNVVLVGGTGTGKTQLMWRARPKNHYGPPRWAYPLSSITASGYGSTPRWIWSTCWSWRRPPANKAGWR